MCVSVYDSHICGRVDREIEFRKCGYRREAAEFLASTHSSGSPFRTPEDNASLKSMIKNCEEIFQVWDDVRIFPNCWDCTMKVMHLGEAEAASLCIRIMREKANDINSASSIRGQFGADGDAF